MGMFDWINTPEIKCYKCGKVIERWQSKDGECILTNLDFRAVDNFYEMCPYCRAWNEYVYEGKNQNGKRPICPYCQRETPDNNRIIDDYKLKVK